MDGASFVGQWESHEGGRSTHQAEVLEVKPSSAKPAPAEFSPFFSPTALPAAPILPLREAHLQATMLAPDMHELRVGQAARSSRWAKRANARWGACARLGSETSTTPDTATG